MRSRASSSALSRTTAISDATLALEAVGLCAALGGAGDRVGELGVGVGEELLGLRHRLLVGGEQLLLGLVALGR